MSNNIQIMIIEDEAIIAEDIRDMIMDLGYDCCGIFHNSEKAIDFLSFNTPDLILCDINIKGAHDGIDVVSSFKRKKKIPVVFLTSMSDRTTLERAKKTLPYGYIIKPFDDRDLLSAIEIALFKYSQEIEALSISKLKIDAMAENELTDSEYNILLDFTKGLTNKQITRERYISINTLKYHTKNLFSKLGVNSRSDALNKIISMLTQSV